MVMKIGMPYLRESTIVPEVTLVREAVSDKSKLAFLDILLDRVEQLLFANLVDGKLVD